MFFLYSLDCPGTLSVDQIGLKPRDLPSPASASLSAGIKGVHHHHLDQPLSI